MSGARSRSSGDDSVRSLVVDARFERARSGSDPMRSARAAGAALLIAAGAQVGGGFLRYRTFTSPAGALPVMRYSTSYFHGLGSDGWPGFAVNLAVTVALGSALCVRPSRVSAALASGYAVFGASAALYDVLFWTRTTGSYSYGPGYVVISGSYAVAALASLMLLRALLTDRCRPSPVRRVSLVFSACAAAGLGVASAIASLTSPGTSAMLFRPVTFVSGLVASSVFVVLAAFPVLAVSLGGKTGRMLAGGIAANRTISVLDTLNRRAQAGIPHSSVHVTAGWWITIAATASLYALATSRRDRPGPALEPDAAVAAGT